MWQKDVLQQENNKNLVYEQLRGQASQQKKIMFDV